MWPLVMRMALGQMLSGQEVDMVNEHLSHCESCNNYYLNMSRRLNVDGNKKVDQDLNYKI